MKRRTWLLGASGALALCGGLAWRLRQDSGDAVPPELWAARWPRPQGGELVMADYRGRPLLLNFWATWCPPCVRELPLLDAFQSAQGPSGRQVIGLAVDRPELVGQFLKRAPVRFAQAVLEAQGLQWSHRLGNTAGGLPFTVVIDGAGRLTQRKAGELTTADLKAWSAGR